MSGSRMCAYHHATAAGSVCSVCKHDICDVCTRLVNARPLCPGCGVGRANQLPWLAGLFSFFMPGAGQVYNGDWLKAVLVFGTGPLILPWIWGVVDAVLAAGRIASGERDASTVATGPVLLGLKILWIPMAIVYAMLAAGVVGGLVAAFTSTG